MNYKHCLTKSIEVHEDGTIIGNLGHKLKPFVTYEGYHYVRIDGKSKAVHRLVAMKYVYNPFNKRCVNHKDGVKANNHYTNLEWVTHKENTTHAYNVGLMESVKNRCELRDQMISELYSTGKYTHTHLAKAFKTTPDNISRILSK